MYCGRLLWEDEEEEVEGRMQTGQREETPESSHEQGFRGDKYHDASDVMT